MERRRFGRTGLEVAVLGFGCGAVGGLMTRGAPADQERAVARAIEYGVNYFDTAAQYGDGASERNLGRVLKALRADVIVGTKVRVMPQERKDIGKAIAAGLEASLQRLGRDSVDLFQLHNLISDDGDDKTLSANMVLNEVVPALERLRREGKTRYIGITALGDTDPLHRVVDAGVFDTAQVAYNVLNPSAGAALPPHYPAHDYDKLLERTQAADMGTINIRVLAGGALSGVEARHPLGTPAVEPIGSGRDYAMDAKRARQLEPLVKEGHADSLIEAGLRFVIANKGVSTVLVGYSTFEHFEYAAKAMQKGPLKAPALKRLAELQAAFVGDAR